MRRILMSYGGSSPAPRHQPSHSAYVPPAGLLVVVKACLAFVITVLAFALLGGCSMVSESPARTAFVLSSVADAGTTLVALNQPGLAEANPLGPLGGVVAKLVYGTLVELFVRNPDVRSRLYWGAAAAQSGFATHNARLLAGDARK